MRRTMLILLMGATLLMPHVALAASTPALSVPEAKPVAQIPVLKTEVASDKAETVLKREVTNIRWANHRDPKTGNQILRLVLDVSGPVVVDGSVTGSPTPQLVVDIQGAIPGKSVDSALSFDGTVADNAKLIGVGTDASRLLVELPLMLEDSDYKIFTLKNDDKANKPYRVVIDISKKVPINSYKFTSGLRNKVIALDPGHGGSDPGAIGPNKTQEKTITLAVAKEVKAMLEKAGAKVLMTRQDDRDVYGPNATAVDELKARASVGNNNKADVFVSVHIDSFTNSAAGGTSTFYYQKTPYDRLLAQSMQTDLLTAGGLLNRGANSANFYVIKRTVMPATLVELGFISNPNEEKLLNTPQYQQRVAQGIVLGLERFFTQAATIGGER